MTLSPRSDNRSGFRANPRQRRARRSEVRHDGVSPSMVLAGTYSLEVGEQTGMTWHYHDLHQLECAFEGVVELETATARYLLPPQQAVWIPAGVEHCSKLTHVKAVSVFFDVTMGLPAGDRVRILAAAPVIREMMSYGRRWPISRTEADPAADTFFDALGNVVVDWLDNEIPLCLPTARDPLVAAAMTHTNEHLADVTMPGLCVAIGCSERSLRRAFLADTGIPWRQYLQESRLLTAMALLAQDRWSVLTIAQSVGFDNLSAFTRAFARFTGEAPTRYRHRIHSAPAISFSANNRPSLHNPF